jgi:LysM repeat protein
MGELMEYMLQFVNLVMVVVTTASFFAILVLVGMTVASIAKNRSVNWHNLLYAAVALFAGIILIRNYPAMIMGAVLDSYRETTPIAGELQQEVMNTFIEGIGGDVYDIEPPVIIEEPVIVNPQSTAVPVPTIAPHPGTQASINTHMVLGGETVGDIAEQYGVSIRSLMEANNLTCLNCIEPGTVLVVPNG